MQSSTIEGGVRVGIPQSTEAPVVVMFMTTQGLIGGIAGLLAGKTVSQMRTDVREGDYIPNTRAVLNGGFVFRKRETKVRLKPGDELWLGGWRPPRKLGVRGATDAFR